MTREDLLGDVAYARSLAEEGKQAPLIGGAYLLLFGMLLAVCYTAQWAVLTGLIDGYGWIGAIWMAFGGAAAIGVTALQARVRKLPGASAVSNRVDRQVWQAVAFAILVVVVSTILRSAFANDDTAPNAIMAAGFGLYGVALYVTATAGGHGWLRGFAILAWLASGALYYFMDQSWTYLAAAAACVLVLLIPGSIMLAREPKTTV